MSKHSSDPRVDNLEVKIQVRDLVRVVDIVDLFAPQGSIFGENSFYQAPRGKWAQEISAGCPQQRYASEESGKVQGRYRVGIVEESCVYLARGVSIRGIFVWSKKPGVQD